MNDVKIQAGGLLKMIHARYQPTEWAVLDELHDGTGADVKRRFDAVAFNCWPSRGMIRLGFEIKVSRADFTKELAAHEKRAALERHCHEVYFVVGPDVCKPREIPEPWGLLEVRGDKLHCTHKAPHRKVGPVAETLAICAIRRLSEAMAAERSRHYRLDDAELTREALDKLIQDKLSAGHEALFRDQMKVRDGHDALAQERRVFVAEQARWWAVWRDIEAAAKGWHRGDYRLPDTLVPPTREQIDEAIARLRMQGAGDLEQRLRSAHASIGAALEAMAPAPELETEQ